MSILRESLVVFALGLSGSIGWIAFRGLPRPHEKESSGVCEAPVASQPTIQWITQTEAASLVGNPDVIFADARGESEYSEGHIAGAWHAPLEEGAVDSHVVENLRGARTVIAYCDTQEDCARSSRLASILGAAGISDVRVLEGGIRSWLAAGLPAEAGACRTCPGD